MPDQIYNNEDDRTDETAQERYEFKHHIIFKENLDDYKA